MTNDSAVTHRKAGAGASAVTDASSGPDRRLLGLDGVRGLAVIAVMLSHAGVRYFGAGGSGGVTVFFVLSGYLITGLLVREHASTGRISLGRFWARRALRLLPALWVMVIVIGIIGVEDRWITKARYLSVAKPALLYYADFVYSFPLFMMDHTWSLGVEEQFYVIWPLLILVLVRLRMPRAAAAIGFAALAVVGAAWRLWLARTPGDAYGYAIAAHRLDACAWALLLGAALSFAVPLGGGHRVRAVNGLVPAATLIGALLICTWAPTARALKINGVTGPLLFGVVAVVLIFAALGSGSRWLSTPVLRWFGRRSYALYLWHFPFVWAVLRGPVHIFGPTRDALLALAVAVVAAELSWWLVERPAAILRGRLHSPGDRTRPLERAAV